MLLAFIFFVLSLIGIVAIFALKEWELRRARVIAPELRDRADKIAYQLKELSHALQADLEKLPPELFHISRIVLHELVLGVAWLLRFLSLQTHKLADLVSHKHGFTRRAPRSEFLQKVIERKNATSVSNGENID